MIEKEITILIADDHPIFQRGLQQIIETDKRLKIVAAVNDGESALETLRKLKPNVAVLDVVMPRKDGFAVLNAVKSENLPCEIILLTMYKEERFFNAALDAGVKGYVLKDSAVSEITNAIHAVARGENFISPMLSTFLIKRLNLSEKHKNSPLESLTASERRVLKLVSEAKNNKQIADELFISIRTVENHRSNICAKLNLEGKNALLTYALTNKSEI
ncbi:MAG TPA: response regulator transcription factor [Pyrinomonadaceae bacterium]|nr:response regulator transcription factor [Pyrinomonadaceae bacterium]